MKSKFQPDTDSAPAPNPTLVDPEALDVSEQQFAASLEESARPQPRFVPEYAGPPAMSLETAADNSRPPVPEGAGVWQEELAQVATGSASAGAPEDAGMVLEPVGEPPEADSWRREVAARVNHYRGRRPRTPRYPSLQLRFEPAESQPAAPRQMVEITHGQLAISMDPEPERGMDSQAGQSDQDVPSSSGGTKILAFPRSSIMPPVAVEELADPVFDRPRILEVPEILPAPPALGGISIESVEDPKDERRPGLELPLKPARLTRRILAGMADALLVVAAFAAFGYIFFRMTAILPTPRQGVPVAAGLLAAFWAAYQYLLLVHTGGTPGLKLARLELSRFDGSAVPRRLRRWRVLASVLSGLSLALGYAWCFLDEDELCWHDRITHTYMAPKADKPSSVSVAHT